MSGNYLQNLCRVQFDRPPLLQMPSKNLKAIHLAQEKTKKELVVVEKHFRATAEAPDNIKMMSMSNTNRFMFCTQSGLNQPTNCGIGPATSSKQVP